LAAVAHQLPSEIIAGAWVRSVTQLRHVEVPLRAHLASYLPGGFMVTVAPAGGVHRITRRRQPDKLGELPAPPSTLLVADHNGDNHWIHRALVPALQVDTVTKVPSQHASTAFWGTKRYVEFAAGCWGTDELLASAAGQPCVWCDEPTSLATCSFCGMRQNATPTSGRQERYAARHAASVSTRPLTPITPLTPPTAPDKPVHQPSEPVGKHARKRAT
jgi:hypothetical protein